MNQTFENTNKLEHIDLIDGEFWKTTVDVIDGIPTYNANTKHEKIYLTQEEFEEFRNEGLISSYVQYPNVETKESQKKQYIDKEVIYLKKDFPTELMYGRIVGKRLYKYLIYQTGRIFEGAVFEYIERNKGLKFNIEDDVPSNLSRKEIEQYRKENHLYGM